MRDEIVKYLGTVAHSSAKTISERVCLDRFEVAKELNAMHGDGLVEREKRGGGGNEYVYWLTHADDMTRLEAALDTLPPVENDPPPMPPVAAAIPEEPKLSAAEKDRARLEAEIFDLRASNANRQEKIRVLETQKAALEKSIKEGSDERYSTLQRDMDALTRLQEDTRAECEGLCAENGALIEAAKEWISKCDALQKQIDQYDERRRFDARFGTRPADVKEAMWESWLERSKITELEKETA